MIELIVLDVDGTMSDGKITYSNSGEELKSFCVKDGLGIASWLKLGKMVVIITGRESQIVEKRARELGVDEVYQGCKEKGAKLKEIAKQKGLSLSQIAAIGDDLNDLSMLKATPISFAPKNASKVVKDRVSVVLHSNGGDGAIREMIEYILKLDSLSEEFIGLWE